MAGNRAPPANIDTLRDVLIAPFYSDRTSRMKMAAGGRSYRGRNIPCQDNPFFSYIGIRFGHS